MVHIQRGDFWEFKARAAEFDLETARLRAKLTEVGRQKDALVDTFAAAYGLDPARPMTFEDTDYSVTQDDSGAGGTP